MVDFAGIWSDIQIIFTEDYKAFKFAGWDQKIPYFFSIVAALILICCCMPCCYYTCCRKKYKRKARGKKAMGLAHAPSTERPHNPDETNDVELGKTTSNPVTKGAESKAAAEKSGSGSTAKPREKPPKAGRKSARASLSRGLSKLMGRETEKWKAEQDEHGRTYYVNQDTFESVWEIPKEDSGGKSSPWIESVDEHGRKYFYNTETGESRWTDPEADCTDGLPSGWQIIKDSTGRSYYYNATTGSSQWDKPTGSGSELTATAAPTQQL